MAMSEEERCAIVDLLRRQKREKTKDRETARSWLIGQKIYDDEGRLEPQYGGEAPHEE